MRKRLKQRVKEDVADMHLCVASTTQRHLGFNTQFKSFKGTRRIYESRDVVQVPLQAMLEGVVEYIGSFAVLKACTLPALFTRRLRLPILCSRSSLFPGQQIANETGNFSQTLLLGSSQSRPWR